MALASLLGGLALANAGLGAVHGFAGPLGGMLPAAHGMICAALLPEVMAANIRALTERAPGHPCRGRFQETAALLTGLAGAKAEEGVSWVRQLGRRLGVPSLGRLGFEALQADEAVAKASRASSMKGNPISLTDEELDGIYRNSL
jgi:alcohol dehydrogenase class IV